MLNQYAANITREDFSRVLAKTFRTLLGERFASEGIAYDDTLKPFSDTEDPDVGWLNSLGIVKGVGEGIFNPSGTITRQEAAVMLTRAAIALGLRDPAVPVGFLDLEQASEWARSSVGFVAANGIMGGTDENMFSPLGMYTRQQSFVTMLRLYNAVLSATP
ncbi:MAG: S-layer homology domain-containing protein [Zoogloeaceae bacterium]|jgi:hypothetical protein|nr:S-layer homology domain-containing protein [Zoogloeaceae bacterium]